jgi:hypothetical protein
MHDPEKACPGLDPGWEAVSRLREALLEAWLLSSGFGGRRQVRKDHGQKQAKATSGLNLKSSRFRRRGAAL